MLYVPPPETVPQKKRGPVAPEPALSLEELSDIVGAIYDCALDPELWPEAIRHICRATRCLWGSIAIHDLSSRAMHLNQLWNCDPAWIAQTARYGQEISATWEAVPGIMTHPLDEPLALSHHLPKAFMENSRYIAEVRRPAGLVDTLALMVMRRRDRIGSLGLQRHESVGVVGEREFEIMRLLAPHVRRSVAISDVLDMKTLHLDTLESILDLLNAAVLFVDRQCKIVYANHAAECMLKRRAPIFSAHGELMVQSARCAEALRRSVAAIGHSEACIGRSGIGIPVATPEGGRALVYVLPLMTGSVRARISPSAQAAVFITDSCGETVNFPVEALAAVFDLTPAEQRILAQLLAGRTPGEIAVNFGVALPTVRSHLASLYAKSGAERQADLILLATQL